MTALGRPKGFYLDDRQLKRHGTNAARARHRYRGEPYCDQCMVKTPNHYGPKPKGHGWKQNMTKGPAEPRVRVIWRACAQCGIKGPVNSKLVLPKEGFLCPDCR